MIGEPRGRELIDRYRKNYRIAVDAPLTEEMILRHWQLEKELTRELLQSRPEDRWDTFERCYTRLYREIGWLNRLIDSDGQGNRPDSAYKQWLRFIGPPPGKIYEIGSGRGELIGFLSSRGYECKATEITSERGEKWGTRTPGLSWGVSDGVHLGRFEPPGTYDAVISDQVIEHLHPDDIEHHFRGVFSILKPGGRYVFITPHAFDGPWDISRVFGCKKPMGMHLKEYTFGELVPKLKGAGFRGIYSPLYSPRKALSLACRAIDSTFLRSVYLQLILLTEWALSRMGSWHARKAVFTKLSDLYLLPASIRIAARKPDRETA